MFQQELQDIPDFRELSWCRVKSARKIHKCSVCHNPIPVGSTYVRQAYVCDGEFTLVKMHYRCTP